MVRLMSKKRVFLHIGSHKTGSTSLQNSLYANKSTLKAKGIYYGGYHEVWRMHHNLAFGLFKEALEEEFISFPSSHYYFSQIAEKPVVVVDRIKQEFQEGSYKQMILSSEGLFAPGHFFAFHSGVALTDKQQVKVNEYVIAKLRELLSDFDVTVICYLRRQDLILESFYNQYCKGPDPNITAPLPTFTEYCKARPVPFDYFRDISVWAKHFGKENLNVKPYERTQLPEGVVGDFYINILKFSESEYERLESIDAGEDNSRINRDVLEYKRLLNVHGLDVEFLRVSNAIGDAHRNQSFLTPQERGQILKDCADSNSRLAAEYLSRSDGRLFYDTEVKKEEPYFGLTFEKSIEISEKLTNLFLLERKMQQSYIKHLLEENINIKYDNATLLQEVERLKKELTELTAKQDVLATEFADLGEEHVALKAEHSALTTEYELITAEKNNLVDQVDLLTTAQEAILYEKEVLKGELRDIYESKSWKVTKPLRAMRDRLK
ncbi:hypothetical protein [Paenibacillus harenae]|uniref:Cell division protein FtsB n=1 Tax=Paenibacillus harenae TaxID=306543 RepID=A0ABT9U6Q2_PAEHA|nr:hypothetical protein [Paenibacillus harenae]MDQ0115233.1 cell division protein FtsB [Paenibacillus harenae]